MLFRSVNTLKKRLLLLLGALLLLAGALPSKATFHVCYFAQGPATVYIDDQAVFGVENDPFRYGVHTVRLRPGVYTLAVRQPGGEVATTWFLYLHFNSTVVEYTRHEHDNEHTWYAMLHVGQFLPD
jgi:hypothetical protein